MSRTRLALLAVAFWPAVGMAADVKAGPPAAADVPKLIEQLADPDYATREAATKRLNDLGAPALTALRTAAESGPPERAERAAALVTHITRRIENEQALAPTVADLPATEQTVREVFDAIERQSRVQLRIDGDQAILTQKVTPSGGKRPFWEHVQDVAAKTGLGVAEVSEHRPGSLRQPEAERAAAITQRRELEKARAMSDTLTEQVARLEVRIEQSKDAAAKAELGRQLAGLNDRLKELTAQIEKLEQKLGVQPALLGHVVLRAAKPNPSCTSGAVRVEVTPASADLLKRYTPGHLPLAVKVFAEPKLEWYRVTETAIFEATGPDGQPVAADSFTPKSFNTLANDELQFRRARLGLRDGEVAFAPATVGLAALAAPAAGKPLTLKSVRGVVRATVWTEPGEVLAVELGEKGEAAGASANASMRVKRIAWDRAGVPGAKVEVTVMFDPTAVRPQTTRPTGDAVWLENGPGGRAVPRAVKGDGRRLTPDQYGLVLADVDGKPLDAAPYDATTYQLLQDGRYMTAVCRTFAVRNAPANDGMAVAKVSFHGTQQKAVEVPFRFTDVTLTPGTGDGRPLPEDYDIRLKR